jgi:regulatory protein
MADRSAYIDGLRLLGGRELSVAGLRARLIDREHAPEDVEAALARLVEEGALDDRRVARAYARTATQVKGRGRLRVQHELHELGIPKDIAAEALGEVFGDLDERALIARAIQKKMRGAGRPRPLTTADRARLYQYLMRQGFTPAAIRNALGRLGGGGDSVE